MFLDMLNSKVSMLNIKAERRVNSFFKPIFSGYQLSITNKLAV